MRRCMNSNEFGKATVLRVAWTKAEASLDKGMGELRPAALFAAAANKQKETQ